MAEDSQQRIMRQYDDKAPLYEELAAKVRALILEMLQDQIIEVHSVTHRFKKRDSLEEKIKRPGKNYSEITDLTDIAAARIITYFDDDVARVKKVLEREFSIDWVNTADKRAALDPDRFGYVTMQHVAALSSDRTTLTEYRRFRGLKFEIQTRSILQHAWAEIEHDLGYKNPVTIPEDVRRRLARLASLLEMGDEEFRRIRDELDSYRRSVPGQIQKDPQIVDINRDSLLAFIRESSTIAQLDESIIEALPGTSISPRSTYDRTEAVESRVTSLKVLGVRTIQDLDENLRHRGPQVLAFAEEWIDTRSRDHTFAPGISVFYLAYLLAAETRDEARIKRFLKASDIKLSRSDDETVSKLIRTYNVVSNQ